MKKIYAEPELEIRKYSLSNNGVLTSSSGESGDLNKDDKYDNIFE